MVYFFSIISGSLISLLLNINDNFITKKIGSSLLQTGIVLLGFTINYQHLQNFSSTSFFIIVLFSSSVFILGFIIGKFLKIEKKISYLVSAAAAICGGTAVAAIAPIIKAKPTEVVNIISILFFFNILSMIMFPLLGEYLDLNSIEFGILSALAIHDTSSVIATAFIYNEESAQIASILKTFRTVLIIPLILCMAWIYSTSGKLRFPLFILFFISAIFTNNYFSFNEDIHILIKQLSQLFIIAGLFCIGTQIDKKSLREISLKPILQFVILWILIIPISILLLSSFIN